MRGSLQPRVEYWQENFGPAPGFFVYTKCIPAYWLDRLVFVSASLTMFHICGR
jgi:hypothetical protein